MDDDDEDEDGVMVAALVGREAEAAEASELSVAAASREAEEDGKSLAVMETEGLQERPPLPRDEEAEEALMGTLVISTLSTMSAAWREEGMCPPSESMDFLPGLFRSMVRPAGMVGGEASSEALPLLPDPPSAEARPPCCCCCAAAAPNRAPRAPRLLADSVEAVAAAEDEGMGMGIAVGWERGAGTGVGSREIVFLRPRLVVPGTFGPVDDEVYLMISVSDGRRRESSTLEEEDAAGVTGADGPMTGMGWGAAFFLPLPFPPPPPDEAFDPCVSIS